MSEYRVKITKEDGQQIKDVSTGVLLYLDTGGNWCGIPFGDWRAMAEGLQRLTAEEFWEELRHAVPDLDQPLDQLTLPSDILDFYHSRGITKVSEIPWEPLKEGLITYLHNIWLTDAIKPNEQPLISVLVAMARNILERKEAVNEE